MVINNHGRSYLTLTLEINKHIDGYIDAYYGPEELKASVEAAPKREPAALLDDVAALQAAIPGDDPARQAYLAVELRAIEGTVRKLNGETFAYLGEVNRLYDISPQKVDESRFTAARDELDTLLPGSGPIADRLTARRKRYELEKEQVLPLLELARAEAYQRTAALFDLTGDNGFEVKLVENQPWGAYNWYLGNGRSLIEFNTDVPVSALWLISTFAHEGYPGHHTEALLKERLLYREKGYAEQAVALLNSPAAVISEAIATTASEIIFPNGGEYDWTVDVLLPAAGINMGETAEHLRRIAEAGNTLRYVSGNAAILYHTNQLTNQQTIDYIQTYALVPPERAAKSFDFLTHQLYGSYLFTYTEGYDLITQAAKNGDKLPLFRRLLTEQILPSQLMQGSRGAGAPR
ncbi:MAG: hypothetical protein H6667_23810 [Ardenticatenaceae bacterium]|nr:hypothetical protein [Ardenticatenaceae bacterium]